MDKGRFIYKYGEGGMKMFVNAEILGEWILL